jgi:glutathione S-transferase
VAFEVWFKPKLGRGEPDPAVIDAKMADVKRWLPILDRGLDGKDWVADALTIGDFAVASTFLVHEESGISLDEVPNVRAWIARVRALDSWQRAVPRFG